MLEMSGMVLDMWASPPKSGNVDTYVKCNIYIQKQVNLNIIVNFKLCDIIRRFVQVTNVGVPQTIVDGT